jgi:hypothetical protein
MHPRAVIRAKVVELLSTAVDSVYPTAAEERVYPTRTLPYKKGGTLPVVSVYALSEDVTPDSVTTAPRELTRELSLVIEAWVKASVSGGVPTINADSAMDTIAAEIEAVMEADPFLDDTAAQSILSSTETDLVEVGDTMMGLLIMTYAVTYRTRATDDAPPDLDDFLTVGSTTNLSGTQDTDDVSESDFTVQEVTP